MLKLLKLGLGLGLGLRLARFVHILTISQPSPDWYIFYVDPSNPAALSAGYNPLGSELWFSKSQLEIYVSTYDSTIITLITLMDVIVTLTLTLIRL